MKKKYDFKRRMLSALLAVVMCLSLFNGMGATVYAAEVRGGYSFKQ